ncbi:hypothetical protein BS78_07G154400 [Paspalum vaginatum]|nr:hypothetical protein BS78_07G154400 [Paspalum vaginatum]
MAAGSSSDALVALVDDFYFSVLTHGRNDADAAGDDELFPISDEKYAAELQLQEVILSSASAAAARSSSSVAPAPPRISTPATISVSPIAAAAPDRGKGECSYASSSSSSRPSSLPVAVASFFCKICMDAVPPSDAHRSSRGCAHAFCGGCLARYVGAKIQDRIGEVRCPDERCGGVLDPELCQGILPREVFERWGAALCESMLLGAKRVYCPYRDCLAMMLVDDGGDVRGDVAESECPSCRRLFCARCAVAPWHAGVTCAEYGRLRKGDRGREDMLLIEMAKGKKWKRCLKCEYFVEKRDGCLHITCRCGFQFCYGCGGSWGITHSACTTAWDVAMESHR